jgi:hypothetical protein
MTAAYFDRDTLYDQACIHFGCAGSVRAFGKPDRKLVAKREKIDSTLRRFRALMSSANPPQTKAQAVEALSPFFALLLSMFFRQLVVEVIEWLWDRTQGPSGDR